MPQSPGTLRIYHNPRCSKSRAAVALMEARGIPTEIVEYLKSPPSRGELVALLARLGMKASEIVRRGEPVFREKYAGRPMSEGDWIDALVADPVLIERPIAVLGERAVLGRPPAKLLDLF